MASIAVAGASGAIGKTVLEELQAAGKHQVYLLGRSAPKEALPGNFDFIPVDYQDVDSVVKLLEEHKVDTVISTINIETDGPSQAQLGLIEAAEKSQTTRRFIPSEFGPYIDENDPAGGPGIGGWIPNAHAIKKTSLEYCRISCGFFMDYWGMPHIHSHLKQFVFGVDVANRKAVIPGTGDEPFSATYTIDLARLIVYLLDKQDWPQRLLMTGSDTCFNEIVSLAEKARGVKFDVSYDAVEKLQKGEATVLAKIDHFSDEQLKALLAGTGMMVVSGACRLPQDNQHVSAMYPDFHATTISELLTKAWTGK
ncbi:hypothetical protein ACJZ2D_013774 [Fusarium nematophilum]